MTVRGAEEASHFDVRVRLPTVLTNVAFLGAVWSIASIFLSRHRFPLVKRLFVIQRGLVRLA